MLIPDNLEGKWETGSTVAGRSCRQWEGKQREEQMGAGGEEAMGPEGVVEGTPFMGEVTAFGQSLGT